MHRITTNDALQGRGGARRQIILDYLGANPGSSLRQTCLGTGLAVGVARHHLVVLERCRMVWHERVANKGAYFVGSYPRSRDAMRQKLESGLDEPLQQVLGWLREEGPVCQREALDAMPWARSTCQHRIDRLAKLGHVKRRHQGRRVYYEVVG